MYANKVVRAFTFFILFFTTALAVPRPYISIWGPPQYKTANWTYDFVNPEAPKGGTVRIGVVGSFDTLNPATMLGSPALLAGIFLMPHLMERSIDTRDVFVQYASIAQTADVSQDQKTVTIALNPRATFDDGKPVLAEDVEFSCHTMRTEGDPLYRQYLKDIRKVEVLDSRTIRFHLNSSKNRELIALVVDFPIFQKAYFTAHKFSAVTFDKFPTPGPYQVESVDPGRKITYVRVKNWWGQNLPVFRGLFNFDRIEIISYRDTNAAFEAFKRGDIDWRYEPSIRLWTRSYDFRGVRDGMVQKHVLPYHESNGSWGFFFNTRRPPFNDIRVRQALAMTVDFPGINKSFFADSYTRANSHFASSPQESERLPTSAEAAHLKAIAALVGQAHRLTQLLGPRPWYVDEGPIRERLLEADRLLKAAGWVMKRGVRVHEKTGQPFVFEFLTSDANIVRFSLFQQKVWKKLGIRVETTRIDRNAYNYRVDHLDFDMTLTNIAQSMSPGNEQREYWGTSSAHVTGTRNLAGVQDKLVDALIESLILAQDYETLNMRTKALDRVLMHGVYAVPTWYNRWVRIAYWDRFGRPESTQGKHQDVPFTYWWLDAAKNEKVKTYLAGGGAA